MRILVTGGAGFIGSHVVRALVARGDRVRVVDDLSTGRRSNLEGVPIELVEGDLTDPAVLDLAIRGVTHVVHLAALVSVPRSVADPVRSHAINIDGTLQLLLAAREQGVGRVVLASSSAVYGDESGPCREDMPLRPLSPYGIEKMTAEAYASVFHRLYGLETVSLRLFNVFGPRQDPTSGYAAAIPRFITRLLGGLPPVVYGDGRQTRDFTYVADAADAFVLALSAPAAAGGVFNVATGTSVTVSALAAILTAVTGQDGLEPEPAPARRGDIVHSAADVSRARDTLGFTARSDLREALRETVRWYVEQQALSDLGVEFAALRSATG